MSFKIFLTKPWFLQFHHSFIVNFSCSHYVPLIFNTLTLPILPYQCYFHRNSSFRCTNKNSILQTLDFTILTWSQWDHFTTMTMIPTITPRTRKILTLAVFLAAVLGGMYQNYYRQYGQFYPAMRQFARNNQAMMLGFFFWLCFMYSKFKNLIRNEVGLFFVMLTKITLLINFQL